jgi:signal transduction histidine kinase
LADFADASEYAPYGGRRNDRKPTSMKGQPASPEVSERSAISSGTNVSLTQNRWLQFAVPMVVFLVVLAALVLSAHLISRYERQLGIENSTRILSGAFRQQSEEVARVAYDYGFYPAGIEGLFAAELDREWADEYYGSYLHKTFGLTSTTAVNNDGRVVYFSSAVSGEDESLQKFNPPIQTLFDQIGQIADGSPKPAVGFGMVGDKLHLVAASKFYADDSGAVSPGIYGYFLVTRVVDTKLMRRIGGDFGIRDLDFRANAEGYFPLVDYAGNALGTFVWAESNLDSKAAEQFAPWAIGGVSVVAIAFLWVLRRNLIISDQYRLLNLSLDEQVLQRTEELNQQRVLAERASRAKTEFVARMGHELYTPMNAILGFAALLEMDRDTLSKEQLESIGYILQAGHQLLSLIDNVLDLSQFEFGPTDLSLATVSLDSTLEQSLSMVSVLANQKQITFNRPGQTHLDVVADQKRLIQVLVNLLSNAIKYSHEGGQIDIAVTRNDVGSTRITIKDRGVGIREEEFDQVFEAFTRVGDLKQFVEGAGISLTITRLLVQAMSGKIGFNSRFGEGSEFWVDLPAREAQQSAAA